MVPVPNSSALNVSKTLLAAGLELPIATRRQIVGASNETASAPRIVSVRLNSGLRSEIIRLKISHLTMPDGVEALLLASEQKDTTPDAIIAGLGDETTHVALIDDKAQLIATSERFAALDISVSTLEDPIIETRDAAERGS